MILVIKNYIKTIDFLKNGVFMKKRVLMLIGAMSASLLAQTGLNGGSDGLHQQSATSLGQWTLSAGFGGEFSGDDMYMANDGWYTDPTGSRIKLDKISPSITTNAHIAFGFLDFLDVGVVVPLYYDMVNPEYAETSQLDGGGMGDLEMWLKYRIPFSDSNVFGLATLLQVTAPTGKEGTGMHPRKVWNINSWGYTDPYTANDWVFFGNLIGTFDFTKKQVPLRWNMNVGFAASLNEGANSLIWGTGLNYIPSSYVDLFIEFSGETRVEKTAIPREPLDDPMRLTPGVRFHLPAGFDLALGLDVGINAFRNPSYDWNTDKGYPVVREKNGQILRYNAVSTAHYAASALLTWKMSFKSKDTDGDGIFDKQDACANTPKEAPVDSVGCPLDSDKDHIPDYLDKCPSTKEGLAVDSTGCLLDSDQDGVTNLDDQCPNTRKGVEVDATGCPMDADKDGVADEKDKCPKTPIGAFVDDLGCPIDTDKDGVTDHLDKCPNTPNKVQVDATGCPLDTDADGILDYLDKCPNTRKGSSVDNTGCPTDKDKDGVADHLDKCPNTVIGSIVDSTGCAIDSDKDGVFDHLDKCPNTEVGLTIDTTGCPLDDDKDGVYNSKDKCSNTPTNTPVDINGCPLDQDLDGVPDLLDKCPNTIIKTPVDSTGCPADFDKDGVPDFLDKCPNTKNGEAVDTTGCVIDSDKDGVADAIDMCPHTLTGVKIDDKGCPVNKKQDLSKLNKGINFKAGSKKLTNASYSTLDDVVTLLRQIPSANLEVQGHTDSKGKDKINLKLSQDRAQTVVDYLIKKGIDEKRVRAIGYGSERPIADNETKKGRKLNRRVELVPFEL